MISTFREGQYDLPKLHSLFSEMASMAVLSHSMETLKDLGNQGVVWHHTMAIHHTMASHDNFLTQSWQPQVVDGVTFD